MSQPSAGGMRAGTFDAEEIRIAHVMSTTVQTVDSGQLWLPLDRLRRMARMDGEATWSCWRTARAAGNDCRLGRSRITDFLLSDLTAMVRMKNARRRRLSYAMLLFLAMLAILDTQVLSIFHRRKEIGTLMALGLTRGSVIRMFTMEGAFNAVLAALVGAVYGIPLLAYARGDGHARCPPSMEQQALRSARRLYPAY